MKNDRFSMFFATHFILFESVTQWVCDVVVLFSPGGSIDSCSLFIILSPEFENTLSRLFSNCLTQ